MRKLINITLLMSMLLCVFACAKVVEPDEAFMQGEIAVSPVVPNKTKGVAGAVNDYPEDETFGVFAYYSSEAAGVPWSGTGELYLGTELYGEQYSREFKHKGNGVFGGVTPCYWPLSGSLIFAGYSPIADASNEGVKNVRFSPADKTFTISDYVSDGKTDLMFFLPELNDAGKFVGVHSKNASVSINFHHAMATISFEVATRTETDKVNLKSISLVSVKNKGDFTASYNTDGKIHGTWSDVSLYRGESNELPENLVIAGSELNTTAQIYEALVIPGAAVEIVGEYEIGEGDNTKSKSFSIKPEDYFQSWEIGKKYTYVITLNGLEPVVITPKVTIQHSNKEDATKELTGSSVTVDLGISDAEVSRIKDLNIKVYSGETLYKEHSVSPLSSSVITFDDGTYNPGNKRYLPKGENKYNVVITYNDGIASQEKTVQASSPEPAFSCNISYVTLLSTLRIRKAYVTISDDVLNEVKMTSNLRIHHGGGYDVDELNVECYSSCYMNERSISLSPSDKYTFGQTSVRFDGVAKFPSYNGKDDKTFVVPSSYSIGERVELASNLEPNVKYALSLDKDYSASSRLYWSSNPGYLAYQSFYSTTNDSVFLYERDDSQKDTKASEYNFSSAGAWISAYDFKYVDANFWFSTTPTYFTCASVWGTEDYDDNKLIVDIYCNSKSAFINRYDWGYSWNITGNNTSYKWNVYKVIDNY